MPTPLCQCPILLPAASFDFQELSAAIDLALASDDARCLGVVAAVEAQRGGQKIPPNALTYLGKPLTYRGSYLTYGSAA